MEIFLPVLIIVGLCVIGLGFNIIFRKDGKFPDSEIGHSKEMRKHGIRCAKEEELRIWGRKKQRPNTGCEEIECSSCSDTCK